MCLFFVDGREIYRGAERVYVSLDGTLHIAEHSYRFTTKDIYETGMAVYLDKPILIEHRDDEYIYCEIKDRNWHTKLIPVVKFSQEEPKRENNKWLYTFMFEGFVDERDYDQLLAVLYDRVPTNPSEIKKNNGIYDDLSTNLEKRFSDSTFMKRHYPRIKINAVIPALIDGKKGEIHVEDFNYQFFSTRAGNPGQEVIFLVGDAKIPVTYERANPVVGLFKVKDFGAVYPSQTVSDHIMEELIRLAEENKQDDNKPEASSEVKSDEQKAVPEENKNKEAFDEMKLL